MIALFFLNIQTQGLEGRRWWKRTRFAYVGSATRFYRRLNEKQRATSIISKRKPRYGSSKSPQVVLQLSSFPLPPYPFEDRSSIEVTFVETDVRHEKKKKKSKRYWEIGLTDPWRSKKSKTKRRKRDKFRDESSFIRFNRRSPFVKEERRNEIPLFLHRVSVQLQRAWCNQRDWRSPINSIKRCINIH